MKSKVVITQNAVFLISVVAYLALGYVVPRSDFPALLALFSLLFGGYYFLLKSDISIKAGLSYSFIFRLLLLLSLPALSDDYFRFLWDGRLFTNGENPFLHLPDYYTQHQFLNIPGLSDSLYKSLNSPHYFSVYPPFCQFIFGLAALISPINDLYSVLVMRFFILAAEMGSVWLLLKLLKSFNFPARNVLLYALNPLVILELTGNLHFEALMIFFTLLAFYFFTKKQNYLSAISLGFAICTKLLPLMLIPFLLKRLGLKKGIIYTGIVALTSLLLFLPFLNKELIAHFSNSLNLYFQKFEFNASVYYILREIGFCIYGYNQIALLGPLLSALTFLGILLMAAKEKEPSWKMLPKQFLYALLLYFLLATIVHPWYLTTIVVLSALSNLRYPLVWTGLAVVSYAAYQTNSYTENPWLLIFEYGGLLIAFLMEKRYSFSMKKPVFIETKDR